MNKFLKLVLLLFLCFPVVAQVTITNLSVTSTTATSAQISWTTSGAANSQVLFGINGILTSKTPLDPALVTFHNETITGIFNGTIFSYAAVSIDSGGHLTQSPTQTFQLCTNTGYTQVSGTVNNFYEYGNYSLTWVNNSGQAITPTVCGVPIATTISGMLDPTGTFSVPVPDNLQVVPSPSQWTVNVLSLGGLGSFTTSATTITGISNNFNSVLSAGAVGKTSHCFIDQTAFLFYPAGCGGGGGGGGVSQLVPNTGVGTLSPLFTFGFSHPTTTPTLTFSLNNASADTVFGNCTGSSTSPSYCSIVTGMLPFTYSGTTTKLATIGTPFSGTSSLICTDASGNLVTTGCPTGTPGTPFSSLQFSSSGTFAGAFGTDVIPASGTEPAQVNIANENGIRYNAGYNFAVSPTSPATLVAGSNTVTMPGGCPAGVSGTDTAANSRWHYIEIVSAGGDPSPNEPVLITGGSCVGGAASGTLTFSAAFTHIAGYQIISATDGLQEVFSDAGLGGPSARVVILPTHSNMQLFAPVYVNTQRLTVEGGGSRWQCFMNDSCLIVGARTAYGIGNSGTYQQAVVKDLMFIPGANQWSVSPSGLIAGGSPTATLNIASCPTAFWPQIPNQLLWLAGASNGKPLAIYGIGEYVTAIGGTCLPGGSGTVIVQQASPGVTNLSPHDAGFTLSNDAAPALEDNANISAFYNIFIISDSGADFFGHGIQIDNDQSALCFNCSNISSNTLRGAHNGLPNGDADLIGSQFYGPGPFGINAGLLHVIGGTVGGPPACIDWWNANDVDLGGNFVCQGTTSFGMRFLNAFGGGGMKHIGPNVHFEGGSGYNPLGLVGSPNIISSEGEGSSLTIEAGVHLPGDATSGGSNATWPLYANIGGATTTQYYYIAAHNNTLTGCTITDCISTILPLGLAIDSDPSANNVTLYIHAMPGASSYDILRVASTSPGEFSVVPLAPYGTGTFLVGTMTLNGTNCNTHAVCTFTDNVAPASLSSYTVISDDTTNQIWYPKIFLWSGSVIDTGENDATTPTPGVNYNGPATCVTTVLYPTTQSVRLLNPIVFAGTYPGPDSFDCIPQPQLAYIPNYGSSGVSIPGATLMPASVNATLKGRINFGFHDSAYTSFYDFVTLEDSQWLKTVSSKDSLYASFRPPADANDSFIGTDGQGQVAFGAQNALSDYIGVIQDGVSWIDKKTATSIIDAIPVIMQNNLIVEGICAGCGPFLLSGTQVSDNFNRANGPLGSNWTVEGPGSVAIVSNNAVVTATSGTYTTAAYTGASFSDDQFASVKIIVAGFVADGVGVRLSSSTNNGYGCDFEHGGGATIEIDKIVSGLPTALVSQTSPIPNPGDILRLEVSGTSLACYLNGTLILTTTDSTYASGSPGFLGANASAIMYTLNQFRGGNLNQSTNSAITIDNTLTLTPAVFARWPACGSGNEGTMAAITDSMTNTWGATITGSGSDHVLGYCDGTNWSVAAK